MSEFQDEQRYRELLEKRSELYRRVAMMVDVGNDLLDNSTIQFFMAQAKEAMNIAIEQICEASPSDLNEITRCIVNIKMALYLKRCLERLKSDGEQAASEIADQEIREAHDLDAGRQDTD
jgi:hypothetical protein